MKRNLTIAFIITAHLVAAQSAHGMNELARAYQDAALGISLSQVRASIPGEPDVTARDDAEGTGTLRIHGALQRLSLNAGDEQVSITASLGVADYPASDVASAEDLIDAADEALYGAKRGGKNRYSAVRALGGVRSSGTDPVMRRAPRS